MKIAIPENVTNSLRFKVGDLYAAGGNSSNTAPAMFLEAGVGFEYIENR